MKHLSKITAILVLIVGVFMIFQGVGLMDKSASHSVASETFSYSASGYDADYASFGGDFYTYVYRASDIIVDELDDISYGMSTIVRAQNAANKNIASSVKATDDLTEAVYEVGGMLVIAIGAAITAYGLHGFAVAFKPAIEVAAQAEEAPRYEQVPANEPETPSAEV